MEHSTLEVAGETFPYIVNAASVVAAERRTGEAIFSFLKKMEHMADRSFGEVYGWMVALAYEAHAAYCKRVKIECLEYAAFELKMGEMGMREGIEKLSAVVSQVK